MIAVFAIALSFSSFASSQYALIGGSCWKCVGGSFKTGEIECTPERTARLYEANMKFCDNFQTTKLGNHFSDNEGVIVTPESDRSREKVLSRIHELERELSKLKEQI